jgi:AbrB family looped-hinge helix DNA binding protein
MARITSKRQLTIPKAIADRYGIREGDDLEFVALGDAIRLVPAGTAPDPLTVERRLELFDAATERQRAREANRSLDSSAEGRGWTREELYPSARAR